LDDTKPGQKPANHGDAAPAPSGAQSGRKDIASHPAVGMWADRKDMADVGAYVRKLRKGRF